MGENEIIFASTYRAEKKINESKFPKKENDKQISFSTPAQAKGTEIRQNFKAFIGQLSALVKIAKHNDN